ncbi:unnamed protein product [Rotaria magnacalcarata]|uniref:F-box domain-containing protein n=2 Tax=Rotaria magnacalcarata TaxID=392030 RepID=A0A816UZN5_9BILA|nr:unnamed protein product [Rotaria magnacalcarata]CAF4015950.1 unnamed protein product [Rotaria magnacalcarata]
MICKFEILLNEVLLSIFSYLSWLELLNSVWSLNNRINYLICFLVSINNRKKNSGISIKQLGLSYNECYLKLLPLLNHSSLLSFCSSIRRLSFDGTNSIACDINYEWIFYQNNTERILRFPNLKTLILTKCWLSESLITNLSLLIQYQLNELTLIFDEETFNSFKYETGVMEMKGRTGNY